MLNQTKFRSFSITPNISREEKFSFLKSLSIFSVPARYPEAFGLYVVEALLAGSPVVLPNTGAFPEIVESTRGGKLYDPSASGAFTETLDELLNDPQTTRSMGLKAHQAVLNTYSNEKLAKRLVDEVVSPLPVKQK